MGLGAANGTQKRAVGKTALSEGATAPVLARVMYCVSASAETRGPGPDLEEPCPCSGRKPCWS